jgi:hypothetical protein
LWYGAVALCVEQPDIAQVQRPEHDSSEASEELEPSFPEVRTVCRDWDLISRIWQPSVGTAGARGEMAVGVEMNSECCFLFLTEAGTICRLDRTSRGMRKAKGKR